MQRNNDFNYKQMDPLGLCRPARLPLPPHEPPRHRREHEPAAHDPARRHLRPAAAGRRAGRRRRARHRRVRDLCQPDPPVRVRAERLDQRQELPRAGQRARSDHRQRRTAHSSSRSRSVRSGSASPACRRSRRSGAVPTSFCPGSRRSGTSPARRRRGCEACAPRAGRGGMRPPRAWVGRGTEPRRVPAGDERHQLGSDAGSRLHLLEPVPVLLAEPKRGCRRRGRGDGKQFGADGHERVRVGHPQGGPRRRQVRGLGDPADREQLPRVGCDRIDQRRRRLRRLVLPAGDSRVGPEAAGHPGHLRVPGSHRPIRGRGERQRRLGLLDPRPRVGSDVLPDGGQEDGGLRLPDVRVPRHPGRHGHQAGADLRPGLLGDADVPARGGPAAAGRPGRLRRVADHGQGGARGDAGARRRPATRYRPWASRAT